MSTPSTFTTIDATAAVPIDVASKVLLGARHAYWDAKAQVRHDVARARLWVDRQHLNPDQVLQLAVLAAYALVALVEAWTYSRKGR